jgi:hypothetical protein
MADYPYLVREADEGIEGDELYEADEHDEADEAARRPRGRLRPPIRTPQRGGNLPAARPSGFATKADLAATANKLDAKIGMVSTGLKALDGRVRGLDSEQGRLRSSLSAESKKREALVGQVNNLQQLSMLLPLLSTQKTVAMTDNNGNTVNGVVDNGDQFSRILPMLLFSSAGSSGQPGSGGGMFGGGGDNSSMMMLALVMAMTNK